MLLGDSELLGLIETIYASAADGDWGPALRALLPAWRAGSGDILVQEDLIGANEGLDASLVADYSRHYWLLDERRRRAVRRPGEVLTNSRMRLSDSQFGESEFYRDFARQCHSFYALGFTVLLEGAPLSVSVHRPQQLGEFDEHEVAAMECLQPHVVRAIQLSRRLLQARQALSDVEAALDRLPSALLLLDGRGKPTLVNRAARRILRARDGLWLDRDGLRAATPTLTARLRKLILQSAMLAVGRSAGGGGLLHLPRPSGGPPLVALATPLPASSLLSAASQAAVALLLRDPSADPRPAGAWLERLYGLTPAEGRLAARLATGEPLDEAADALHVTRETVRSQLKAIFDKTATRRQGELLRKLALDAALLPEAPKDEPT